MGSSNMHQVFYRPQFRINPWKLLSELEHQFTPKATNTLLVQVELQENQYSGRLREKNLPSRLLGYIQRRSFTCIPSFTALPARTRTKHTHATLHAAL